MGCLSVSVKGKIYASSDSLRGLQLITAELYHHAIGAVRLLPSLYSAGWNAMIALIEGEKKQLTAQCLSRGWRADKRMGWTRRWSEILKKKREEGGEGRGGQRLWVIEREDQCSRWRNRTYLHWSWDAICVFCTIQQDLVLYWSHKQVA